MYVMHFVKFFKINKNTILLGKLFLLRTKWLDKNTCITLLQSLYSAETDWFGTVCKYIYPPRWMILKFIMSSCLFCIPCFVLLILVHQVQDQILHIHLYMFFNCKAKVIHGETRCFGAIFIAGWGSMGIKFSHFCECFN